ncbi:Putative transcription antitermination factor NusB [endosymbiont DhMRE of Dentiscutata heterogama]|uniref:transcription antitermination factor NusB n=1 Tax=endosymbiont DhMRE of Dentiscutata heterogama TaxID=1609546 RepID=UPI000629D437|nr:transcription antitermination factor NusB [endosymbiont DhMRE of Dentiscutata heterogama]CFW92760.1 Putative transcription antitermination factor NusB [endosymbiont DhMRE of Dentiscutata heterogama]
MFRLDKRKIFLLYHYYLLGKVPKIVPENEKEKARIVWLNDCLIQEKFLQEKITKKMKTGWAFFRSPPLERAILTYATYELLCGNKADLYKMIIDQTVNFSKSYLGKDKYKYINKILDSISKERNVCPV